MQTSGRFVKGEKKPNQGNRGPAKATLQAREAISKLADGNVDKLQGWLDRIAEDPKQGPAVAFKLFMDVLEYHIPKLARTEVDTRHSGEVGITMIERVIVKAPN